MDNPCSRCGGPRKTCDCPRDIVGRESCKAPGMAHRARNCTDDGCAVTGICHYAQQVKDSTDPVQLPLLKPAGTIPDPECLCGFSRENIPCPVHNSYACTPRRTPPKPVETIPVMGTVPEIVGFPKKVDDFKGLVDGGGYKASMDDPRKVPVWLVPISLIFGVARILGYGAKKYAANNWRRGMKYSEVYSAIQRHLLAWLEGEDNDPESGMSHLWHAGCGLAFLCEYIAFPKLYGRFDDRFNRPEAE